MPRNTVRRSPPRRRSHSRGEGQGRTTGPASGRDSKIEFDAGMDSRMSRHALPESRHPGCRSIKAAASHTERSMILWFEIATLWVYRPTYSIAWSGLSNGGKVHVDHPCFRLEGAFEAVEARPSRRGPRLSMILLKYGQTRGSRSFASYMTRKQSDGPHIVLRCSRVRR